MTPDQVARMLAQLDAVLPLRRSISPVFARTRFVDTEGIRVEGAQDQAYRIASHWVGTGEHLVLVVPEAAGRQRGGMPALTALEVQLQPVEGPSSDGPWRVHRYVARVGRPLERREAIVMPRDGWIRLQIAPPGGDSAGDGRLFGDWEAWHLEGLAT